MFKCKEDENCLHASYLTTKVKVVEKITHKAEKDDKDKKDDKKAGTGKSTDAKKAAIDKALKKDLIMMADKKPVVDCKKEPTKCKDGKPITDSDKTKAKDDKKKDDVEEVITYKLVNQCKLYNKSAKETLKGDGTDGYCYARRPDVPGDKKDKADTKTTKTDDKKKVGKDAKKITKKEEELIEFSSEEMNEPELELDMIEMLKSNEFNTNGMCFLKNTVKRTNGYNDCTIREFSILQDAVGREGGSSAAVGMVFLYIFLAVLLSVCCVFCGVSIMYQDEDFDWNEVFCCCCRDRQHNDDFDA